PPLDDAFDREGQEREAPGSHRLVEAEAPFPEHVDEGQTEQPVHAALQRGAVRRRPREDPGIGRGVVAHGAILGGSPGGAAGEEWRPDRSRLTLGCFRRWKNPAGFGPCAWRCSPQPASPCPRGSDSTPSPVRPALTPERASTG